MGMGRRVVRVWKRLADRGSVRNVDTSVPLVNYQARTRPVKPLSVAETDAIEKSSRLWAQEKHYEALSVLRHARFTEGVTADLQVEYGLRALELDQAWAAREAFHDAVDLDVAHLDALELFLHTNQVVPPIPGAATRAVSALADLIPHAPLFDVEAATLILPSMPLVETVDRQLRMLRHSADPVAARIGDLVSMDSSDWEDNSDCAPLEDIQAKLIILLMRGELDVAYGLLAASPSECLPQRAMRMAIRRELRNERFKDARTLIQCYIKKMPRDKWAHEQLQKIGDLGKYLSDTELTADGFPLPAKSNDPKYSSHSHRVLYLLHSALPLHSMGYATRTHGLLRGVREHGWDVQGVTRLGYPFDMPNMESLSAIKSNVAIDGVPYHRLSTSDDVELKTPLQAYISRYKHAVKKLALESKPFVLHAASNHWNGLTAVSAANELGIPSVYEVRGLWEITRGSRNPEWMNGKEFRYMARMETDAANAADQVITITQALRDELVRRGVDSSKITIVPNGVDTSRFKARPRNKNLVTKLGLENKTVVGYVGSILNYEGIGLLLDAARRLKAERDDLMFLFIGDGAELTHYRERVADEGLSGSVIFTGRVPHEEVEEYYSVIDIAPFPRLPWPVCEMVSPLKPFEAMAMEKTVIASDVAALAEIVVDGETGALFQKGNPEALIHVLRNLLDSPDLRVRLAKAGRQWVEQERDWRVLAKKIDAIYCSLGGAPTAGR